MTKRIIIPCCICGRDISILEIDKNEKIMCYECERKILIII